MVMAKPMAIAMIIAIVEMAKYISVGGCAATGCGGAVAIGELTVMPVCAFDGQ